MKTPNDLTGPYYFYNNTIELWFSPKRHIYYRKDDDLTPVRGVTNIIKILDKSSALIPWAAKKVTDKLLALVPIVSEPFPNCYLNVGPLPLDSFKDLLEAARTAPRDILETAGDIGTLAHDCLEKSIKHAIHKTDGIVKGLIEIPKNEKSAQCTYAAFDWMVFHNVRWKETERKVYSKQYEYAGTMDGIALVDSCADPNCCPIAFEDTLSLIDWKSSNGIWIEYFFQTASYQQAYEEENKEPIDSRFILRLGKEDGEFEALRLPLDTMYDDFRGFAACLNLTKLAESARSRLDEFKKLKKSQKKLAKSKKV